MDIILQYKRKLSIMEDMHEMPQVICLYKSATKQIKIGKIL